MKKKFDAGDDFCITLNPLRQLFVYDDSPPLILQLSIVSDRLVYKPNSPEAQKFVQNRVDLAVKILFGRTRVLFEALNDRNSTFSILPYDLMKLLIVTKTGCIALKP